MSTPHLFTVDEWHQMGVLDAFGEAARMELLDGELFDMSPVGPSHAACMNRLTRLLVRARYWSVDRKAEQLVVRRDPSREGYRSVVRYDRPDEVAIESLPRLAVAVADVLAPVA